MITKDNVDLRTPAFWGLCGSLFTAPTLFIADVLALSTTTLNSEQVENNQNQQDIYFYGAHKRGDGGMPLRAVVVQGTVVGVQQLPGSHSGLLLTRIRFFNKRNINISGRYDRRDFLSHMGRRDG